MGGRGGGDDEAATAVSNATLSAKVVASKVYLVLRSRLGLRMQAIRDNEAGARGLGTNVYRTRFAICVNSHQPLRNIRPDYSASAIPP